MTLEAEMRLFPVALLALGCSPKTTPAPAAEEAPAEAPVAPTPAPEPAPAPAPAAPEPNLDVDLRIDFADGTQASGHAVRVERSNDFYAKKDWTDTPMKLTVPLEEGDTEVEVAWSEVRSIDIRFGGSEDVDCSYDSTYEPMLYICELNTTTTVRTADGASRPTTNRYKWRFSFEDGTHEDLWIHKVALLKQESEELKGQALQIAMRDEILAARKGRTATKITVTPR